MFSELEGGVSSEGLDSGFARCISGAVESRKYGVTATEIDDMTGDAGLNEGVGEVVSEVIRSHKIDLDYSLKLVGAGFGNRSSMYDSGIVDASHWSTEVFNYMSNKRTDSSGI